MTGMAAVTGTLERPIVRLRPHTTAQQRYAAALKGSRYVQSKRWYVVTETPSSFEAQTIRHGFHVGVDPALGANLTLAQLRRPYATLSPDGLDVIVHPRLGGKDSVMDVAGWAAEWLPKQRHAIMPLLDAHRPGIDYSPEVQAAFRRAMARDPRRASHAALAAELSASPTWPDRNDHGALVADLARPLFAFQGPGALAVALGHSLLADPPGVGKTATSLAAAHITHADRVVVACPPLLVTNWQREVALAGLDDAAVSIRAGQKLPATFGRVVVVADSLLHRPDVLERLVAWAPDVFVVDEAHRMRNRGTKRSHAALTLAQHARLPIAVTGTPVVSGPHELVPILELTGHIGAVFGGPSAFLERYCHRNKFGKFRARDERLHELHTLLMREAMVRRSKAAVLPFLPSRHIVDVPLDVDVKAYRAAVEETVAQLTARLRKARTDGRLAAVLAELRESTGAFLAPLRQAAARLKIPACAEKVLELLDADEGPVVVWAHHREPVDELAATLEEQGVPVARLQGGMPEARRQEVVDAFQGGRVPVVVASIHAAGVGITLTAGHRAVFLEADWTPALVSQAVDRQHRIGQERPVIAEVLTAVGTIDEHVQRVLLRKGETAAAVHGDRQDSVAVVDGVDDLITPSELVEELLQEALRRLD